MPHPLPRDAAPSNLATHPSGTLDAEAELYVAAVLIIACLFALTIGGATWMR
jgi:hypothetical protein